MIENIKSVLISPRFMSFYWRTGAMVLAGFTSLLLENLGLLHLSAKMTIVIGLILGELSKALNNFVKDQPLGFRKI